MRDTARLSGTDSAGRPTKVSGARGVPLSLWTWEGGRPPLVLLHGTGLTASCLFAVAEILSRDWDVYAPDRRGHGASGDPGTALAFADFADDVAAVLDLRPDEPWCGVGHSAGGTDLLLAAGNRPHRFAALFCHEATATTPPAPAGAGSRPAAPDHDDDPTEWIRLTERRLGRFPGRADARSRYQGRGIFADWTAEALDAYVAHGLTDQPDGSVALACPPDRELAILRPIIATMENRPEAHAWFRTLPAITCPVTLADSADSLGLFKAMNDRVAPHLHQVQRYRFAGGHCLPMERPDVFATIAARALQGRL